MRGSGCSEFDLDRSAGLWVLLCKCSNRMLTPGMFVLFGLWGGWYWSPTFGIRIPGFDVLLLPSYQYWAVWGWFYTGWLGTNAISPRNFTRHGGLKVVCSRAIVLLWVRIAKNLHEQQEELTSSNRVDRAIIFLSATYESLDSSVFVS